MTELEKLIIVNEEASSKGTCAYVHCQRELTDFTYNTRDEHGHVFCGVGHFLAAHPEKWIACAQCKKRFNPISYAVSKHKPFFPDDEKKFCDIKCRDIHDEQYK